MSGVGQHASVGAATGLLKTAMLARAAAAITAANEAEVDVRMGFVWPAQWDDAVAVTGVRTTPDEGALGERRRRHQTVYVDLDITVFRVTDSEQEVHDRAYHLLDVIDQAVRAEPTLDGAALWCFSDELLSDGATAETDAGEGRVCEIAVTYAARVIVTN
jgi:hypothetical protein